jgi:ubiquinone/menaquinone biosynthesis C-methylase UbiE
LDISLVASLAGASVFAFPRAYQETAVMNPADTSCPEPTRGHSEDYFGAYRDYWWNADFAELMARRLGWASRRRVLEVGCGAGHWTRIFAKFLGRGARVTCVDKDPKWSNSNPLWATAMSRGGIRVEIRQADAHTLPFPDGAFDFVTCQTVLIHLADPSRGLAEMVRVLEPGGLLFCVEPDNFATCAGESSLSRSISLSEEAAENLYALIQARGRVARGLGNLSLGGRVPGMFASAGLTDIQTHVSDKAIPLYPPYDATQQAALIGDIVRWYDSGADFSKEEARANHGTGGGADSDFETQWSREVARRDRFLSAIRTKTYDCGGGALVYLVSGVKGPTVPPTHAAT